MSSWTLLPLHPTQWRNLSEFDPISWEFGFENFAQNLKLCHPKRSTLYAGHFHTCDKGYLFDFTSTHAISTPVKSIFRLFFVQIFFRRPTAAMRLVSKYVEFSCPKEKFVERCPPTQTPTQNLKIWFSTFPGNWNHFEWFLKLYNLRHSDSSCVFWVQKS